MCEHQAVLAPSSPTGQVFNSTTAFVLPGGKPALFLFATEDGTISGWYNGIDNNEAAIMVNQSGSHAIYKGLAIATSDTRGPLLLAADFHGGSVEAYDGRFAPVSLTGTFKDPALPTGYAPFNIYIAANKIYVAYAKQDDDGEDDEPGEGNGYISVFDLRRPLPATTHLQRQTKLTMGNGDRAGEFRRLRSQPPRRKFRRRNNQRVRPSNGRRSRNTAGWQRQADRKLRTVGIAVRKREGGGDADALYFTAGISGPGGDAIETHGLLGSIQASPSIRDQGVVNAAGFQTIIAPGAWITIFGRNLSPTTRVWKDSDFVQNHLPVQLDDVSVTIDGRPAYISYVSPTQLNVLAAAGTAVGQVPVQTKSGGLASTPVMVDLSQLRRRSSGPLNTQWLSMAVVMHWFSRQDLLMRARQSPYTERASVRRTRLCPRVKTSQPPSRLPVR